MKQSTIKQSVELQGKGLHTGIQAHLSIHPADKNHGIVFRRTDIEGQPLIKAEANLVVQNTTLYRIRQEGSYYFYGRTYNGSPQRNGCFKCFN